MNTRQKLTLGIAAIFMVTLTIIGVTYAFFVTRVVEDEGEGTNAVQVGTATVASIEYGEDSSDPVEFTNIIPGESETKTFNVTNPNVGAKGTFDIILTSAVPTSTAAGEVKVNNTIPFIHTMNDEKADFSPVAKCYEDSAFGKRDTLVNDCYSGTYYDHVTYKLYADSVSEANLIASGRVMHNALAKNDPARTQDSVGPQVIATGVEIEGAASANSANVDNYIIVFTYEPAVDPEPAEGKDANLNQNIENFAALNIKVSIQ